MSSIVVTPGDSEDPLLQGLLMSSSSLNVRVSSTSIQKGEHLKMMHRTHTKLRRYLLSGVQKLCSVFKEINSCIFVFWVHISLNTHGLRRGGVEAGIWNVRRKNTQPQCDFPILLCLHH